MNQKVSCVCCGTQMYKKSVKRHNESIKHSINEHQFFFRLKQELNYQIKELNKNEHQEETNS